MAASRPYWQGLSQAVARFLPHRRVHGSVFARTRRIPAASVSVALVRVYIPLLCAAASLETTLGNRFTRCIALRCLRRFRIFSRNSTSVRQIR